MVKAITPINKNLVKKATSSSFYIPSGGNAELANAVIRDSQREHAEIAILSIVPNPRQPRKYFDVSKLNELAESIQKDGLIEEIVVRNSPTQEGVFEIICGERRYKACSEILGWTHIPAEIRNATDAELLRIALIENEQREQLSAPELADGYKELYDMRDSSGERIYSIRSLATELGKNKDHVLQHLQLAEAPPQLKQLIQNDPAISVRIVCELMEVDNTEDLTYLLAGVRQHRYTNEDMIALVRDLKKQRTAKSIAPIVSETSLSAQEMEQEQASVPETPPSSHLEDVAIFPSKITTISEHERVVRPSLELVLAERKRALSKDSMQIERIVKRYKDDYSSMSEPERVAVQEKVRQWVDTFGSLLESSAAQ